MPTAAAAVTAIINAYTELYNSQDKQLDNQRLNLLEGSQKELRAQIDVLTEALRAKAQAYGTTQLDASFLELQNRRNRVEGALNDIRITMAESGGVATPGQPPHAATSAKVRRPSPPRHHSLTARRNMRSITSAARAPQPPCVSGSLRSEFASNVRGFECRPRHEASA